MRNRWMLLIFCFLAAGFWLSSCNRPIPTQKRTLVTPIPATLDSLAKTRTNIAGQIMATLTAVKSTTEFAPLVVITTPSGTVDQTFQTQTATTVEPTISETLSIPTASTTPAAPTVSVIVTVSPSAIVPSPSPAQVLPTAYPTVEQGVQPIYPVIPPAQTLPAVYTLHKGEFPWCIARRYNINPRQMMCLNGFCNGQIFYPGQQILIPQNGQPFPGPRALRPHPAAYTVRPGDTIYKIACYYGDIDPILLAQINNLPHPYHVRPGQVLILP